jgi:hypothetical protein
MRKVRAHVGALGLLAAVTLLFVGMTPASAQQILIGDFVLSGPGPTQWDPDVGVTPCVVTGFSPVDDGMFGDRSDAFDDGLVLGVDGSGFDDPDGYAPVSLAEKIATGPSEMSGLSVSRVDEVLQQSPTMRSLVKLANPTATGKTVDVSIESNLGSDSSTAIVATSSGDTTQQKADRWTISNDGSPTSGDPVMTLVYFGKHAPVPPSSLDASLNATNDCSVLTFHVKVKAHSARYLLFFAQMHENNKKAKSGAVPFNLLSSGSALLDGIPGTVQSKIANWSL